MSGRQATPGQPIQRIPLLGVSPEESLDSPIDRRSDYYRQRAREEQPPPLLAAAASAAAAGKTASSGPVHNGLSSSPVPQPLLTAPNILTFARVLMVPVLVALWFYPHRLAPLCAALTFIFAAITDWADGYLARRMKVTTVFGAFLDPVADKIMVSTVLVLLSVSPPEPLSHKDLAVPVVIMIGREITMSALREWAAASGGGAHKAVKVNSLGKWKTALQMVAMSGMLLLHKAQNILGSSDDVLEAIHLGARISLVLLWAGAFLAVWSLSNYMANVWTYFRYPPAIGSSSMLMGSPQNSPRPHMSPRLATPPVRKNSLKAT